MKIVVPVSGGKDSQVCLKLARESYAKSDVIGLFCDTQWEHPLTYEHINHLTKLYDVEIISVTGGSVPEKILKYGRFPTNGARFCTRDLKIRETKIFLKDYSMLHDNIQVWYGMRSDESVQRAKRYLGKTSDDLYLPNDVLSSYPKYLGKRGVRFKLPIIDWSTEEVFDFLGGKENPLYSKGAKRVGCFPCLASSDKSKIADYTSDDFGKLQYDRVLWLESETGKSQWNDKNNSSGCSICSI